MVNLEKQPKNMTVQVYMGSKAELLGRCTVLIAQEGSVIPVPVDVMAQAAYPDEVVIVKTSENMASKAAIVIAQTILNTPGIQSPVFISCTDKPTLDALCSVEYPSPDNGKPIRLVAAETAKPAAPAKKTPDRPRKASAPKSVNRTDKPEAKTEPVATVKTDPPKDDKGDENAGAETVMPKPEVQDLPDADPDLVTPTGEVNLEPKPEYKDPEPTKSDNAASRILHIMRTKVPAGCIAPCLDAIREADDPEITLPLQVRLKLARSGFDANPDEITAKLAPVFAEIKALMAEAAK